MKSRELTATIAILRRLLADPRLETAYRENLRKGLRELEDIRRSGKLDRKKVFRAISLISSTLVEMLPDADVPVEFEALDVER
jgi:hypothetical protein